ncbi:MAG: hypothetical protein PHP14_01875 [Candidatus Pacebacteria bacterium]|nr:hypothetical protein [Candidatus Paceibacterota bacterium]
MKKIFVLVLMLLLCISASNAQAFSLTDTISSAVTSITSFFKDIGNMIGIKSPSEKNDTDYIIDTSDSFADFASISG